MREEKVYVIPTVRESCGYEERKSICNTHGKRELWVWKVKNKRGTHNKRELWV